MVEHTDSIGIDHENVFVEGRVDSNNISHLVINLQLHRRHWCIKVDTVEVVKEKDLRVTFTTIAGL